MNRAAAARGDEPARLRVLTATTLYPNAANPAFATFVETRLRHLVASGEATARVLAPVPWFPFRHPRFARYARFAAVPRQERRGGIVVDHPRYPLVPRYGMTLAPYGLYWTMARALRNLLHAGQRFDLIDAHYLYPDGVAAVWLGRKFGLPVAVTARGNDVTLIPNWPRQRRMVIEATRGADAVITVAAALKSRLIAMDADGSKITVLRNGVDAEAFRPGDRAAIRARLGLRGRVLASVGHLIERKGHNFVIEALTRLPDVTLLLVGGGEEEAALKRLAGALGLGERVRFIGQVLPSRLPDYYSAADALVLASSREGWPNVLLEAMACGTPALATPVDGTPEIITEPAAGLCLAGRSADAIVAGVEALFADPPDRAATRAFAERFGWRETTDGQLALFRQIVSKRRAGAPPLGAEAETATR